MFLQFLFHALRLAFAAIPARISFRLVYKKNHVFSIQLFGCCDSKAIVSPSTAKVKCPLRQGGGHEPLPFNPFITVTENVQV
jgi:hypothetical protein